MHYFIIILKNSTEHKFTVELTTDFKSEIQKKKNLAEQNKQKIKLLYYEHFSNVKSAIDRNTELRNKTNEQINELIKSANPFEEDLASLL